MFVANTPMVENTMLNTMFNYFSSSQLQSFKTNKALVLNNNPMWNTKFEIRVNDPNVNILSILVKSQQNLLYRPIIGVCVINLKNLIDTGGLDQWFPLRKGPFQTGHIRLQLLLKKIECPTLSPLARGPSSLPNDARTFEKNRQSEDKRFLSDQPERKYRRGRNEDKPREHFSLDQTDRPSSAQEPDSERRAFDDDLYGQSSPVFSQTSRNQATTVGIAQQPSEIDLQGDHFSSRSIEEENDANFKRFCEKPTHPHRTKKPKSKRESKSSSDSELSSSSLSSESYQRHRRYRKKHKRSRPARRRRTHKHRSKKKFLPRELPTSPRITVLAPPPNGNRVDELVKVASKVASVALLGADYTKAFSNKSTAVEAAVNVTLEGESIVSNCDFFGEE
ncbi:hypothetical protein P3T76_008075 [Phytophthora citrophthora]|uniref:C2 domain-containing protein n=1 Tax=Phytophthora citrophthora TaxID=4793 RepID=A0AAD9GLI4_9STRA|nr:hypothetical protein P3T76_008075 [Phytophthora citrophthora]